MSQKGTPVLKASENADIQAYIADQREQSGVKTADDLLKEHPKVLLENTAPLEKRRPRSYISQIRDYIPSWGRTFRFISLYMALPFVTGVMAGMGEIFANELMYRWGWRGARPIMVPGRNGRVYPIPKEKTASSTTLQLPKE
ncbi:hypothetical protein COEREDRAFT_85769 [Coemansia reversa NRRL 1564]|uniref:Uncharacterized protein n=1 Tax=Coemansia reversa (strain ATCC 12441 / NRRL 1564) TaxID=763665 RepID=A0A2G5BFW6_COERN|nr:hypothetical protein COEREDRAFT_85769 [Coemansia reversa NRRL 1564]|eukprot:PIA17891.1 hypothetical protein COEREDRAFT_85769 [Coemansia reversa NRRL 1564]